MTRRASLDDRAAAIDRRTQQRLARKADLRARRERLRTAASAKNGTWKRHRLLLAAHARELVHLRKRRYRAEDRLRLLQERLEDAGSGSRPRHGRDCPCYDCLWVRTGAGRVRLDEPRPARTGRLVKA